MARRPTIGSLFLGFILSLYLFLPAILGLRVSSRAQESKTSTTEKKSEVYPRGLKLMLADGTYQLVREYQRNGEHVRYFSMERGAWEELPASLVDWNATAKAEAEMAKQSAELVEKAHKQEEARRLDNVSDFEGSWRVGDGAFLRSGEGMDA